MDDIRNKELLKIEITQDKLVDLLLHAATREDIALLRQEAKEDMTSLKYEAKEDMASLKQDVREDIATFKQEVKEDIATFKQEVKVEINTLEANIASHFKWAIGTTLGVGATLIGVMIGLASFLTHYISH